MDVTGDLQPVVELLCGLAIAVGVVGVVVPVLPGLLLVVAAVLVWALVEQSAAGWAVLGLAVLVGGAAQVVKYLVPGRRMLAAGVPTRTVVIGGLLGAVGFFVVPVVGLFLGFVLGVYLAERVRLPSGAWASTRVAVGAAALSVLIELAAALVAAAAWLAAVLLA